MAYTKTKLEHLTEYMVEHIRCAVLDNKIDAWQETATIHVDGEDRGNGGYRAAYWRYNAVISLEAFPHNLLDPRNVLALVACWISDHDFNRDELNLEDPTVSVDILNNESADVAIELEMIEPIELVPDIDGLISWRGQSYRVETVPVDVADEAVVNNAPNDNP